MIHQDDSFFTKLRKILVLYAKAVGFVFAALIVGFIAFAIFKGAIEPRVTAGVACVRGDGCLYALINGSDSVRVLGFSADGSTILTRGADTLIHSAENGDRIGKLDPDFDSTFQTIIAGDGSLIATLSTRENSVELFTPDGEYDDGWFWPEERDIRDFAFLPLVDGFALSGQDGITMWRLADGKKFTTLPGSEGVGLMVTSAEGNTLAAFNRETDTITIWPLENIANRIDIREAGLFDGFTRNDTLQISADGNRLAAYTSETASVWDTATGDLLLSTSLTDLEISVRSIGLAANGARLAVGYSDGVVEVWSIDTGDLLQLFEHRQSLNGIALSPDGTKLAVGQLDDAVVTQITWAERQAARRCASRGSGCSNAGDQFLTPGQVYIETIPGYALVREVAP